MNYDEVYSPDRRIRDVYEKDWEAERLEDRGLSPYARIGSLAHEPARVRVRYTRQPKAEVNFHGFTYVSPLSGANLSPTIRRRLAHPGAVVEQHVAQVKLAGTALPAPSIAKPKPEKVSARTLRQIVVPSAVILSAIGLVVYAAAFEPYGSASHPLSPTHTSSNPYSPPLILDSKSLIPLQTLLKTRQSANPSTLPRPSTNAGSQNSTPSSGAETTLPGSIVPQTSSAPAVSAPGSSSGSVPGSSSSTSSGSSGSSSSSGSSGTTVNLPSTPLSTPILPESVTVPVKVSL